MVIEMLEELFAIHQEVIATTPVSIKRYLYDQVNWNAHAVCLLGGRGVGKTTMMCQAFIDRYNDVSQGLYVSADNVIVLGIGLFKIAQEYFKYGGKALYIDEVHKYPDWGTHVKNIIDTYRKQQIIISGSSSLDLQQSKSDLSRRMMYYELKGLSFREYLNFTQQTQYPVFDIEAIFNQHIKLADQFKGMAILKHFRDYLNYGYFPFFLEDAKDYHAKLANIIEKVIFEDIAVIYNLKQTTLPILKKILWLVATSPSFIPNIDNISKSLGVSREVIYNCFNYLDNSGLFNNVFHDAKGLKLIRKPGKIYLENTNLLYGINGSLKLVTDKGVIRETFFVNQLSALHKINLHDQGDFIIDGKFIIEVGGPSKNNTQIKNVQNGFLAIDEIDIGVAKKIPLYLFGMMY